MKKQVSYEDSINRNAITITLKKPFYDWADYVNNNPINTSHFSYGTVYLIKAVDTFTEMHEWVEKNFDIIFRRELEDCNIDEKKWPQNRDFALFKEWFNYVISDLILDFEESPIVLTKDEA